MDRTLQTSGAGTDDKALVSVDNVAKHLGIAKDSACRWIERRGLPAQKIGRLWNFKLPKLDDRVRTEGSAEDPTRGDR